MMKKIGKKIISILCVLASVTSSKTSANEPDKIEPKNQNIVNISRNNKKNLILLKTFGIIAGSFVGLAGAIALSAYLYFKIEDKKFKNTDAGKRYEKYKRECEKIDNNPDILKKEKEMAKQRLWKKYFLDDLKAQEI